MRFTILFLVVVSILYADSIRPIPDSVKVDKEKFILGKKLFFETMLSKDKTISCNSCHNLENGGVDGLKYSYGVDSKIGHINSPTVYNAVFNFRQFWDGRAKDLEEQALGPIQNPIEMGMDFQTAIKRLDSVPWYREKFNAIYKDGITAKNIVNAIAEYEKTLITPNAPFDRYLKGDKNAISKQAKRGYELFKYKGCIICHNGVNIGGNLYNKFGIYKDSNSTSLGRYNVTHREEDKYVFKVPSLRNVSQTAPYMHDGRFATLKEAVVFMSQAQLGREISPQDIDDIVSFLKTLDAKVISQESIK